jgi:hypothetical protein
LYRSTTSPRLNWKSMSFSLLHIAIITFPESSFNIISLQNLLNCGCLIG